MEFSIRDYQEKDYSTVAKLWIATEISTPQRGDSNQSILNSISHGGSFLTMVNNRDEVIGTSWITNDSRRLYLHHFCIEPGLQGQGLSKPLLQASLKFAKEKDMQIKLEVHSQNKKALKLYKNAGFKSLGDYQIYIIRKHNK